GACGAAGRAALAAGAASAMLKKRPSARRTRRAFRGRSGFASKSRSSLAGGASGAAASLRNARNERTLGEMALTVFGLTGGIGSGKSTVAAHFAKRGVPIVDADELAREVVRPGAPALEEIVQTFGREVLAADGALDRRALAERVFTDEAARKRLEAITHPRIAALARERFAQLEAEGHTLACYVVPLLFERGLEDTYRPVVTVVASERAQIERAAARDAV